MWDVKPEVCFVTSKAFDKVWYEALMFKLKLYVKNLIETFPRTVLKFL